MNPYVYVKIVIIAAVIAAAGALVYKYNRAIEDAITAEATAAVLAASIQEQANAYAVLNARYNMLDTMLKDKQNEEAEIQNALLRFEKRLGSLRTNDPAVHVWANTPLPPSIVSLLQHADDSGKGD